MWSLTIWWPRSGVRIYQIVTGVTSDVGVPSTHLVDIINIINCSTIITGSIDVQPISTRSSVGNVLPTELDTLTHLPLAKMAAILAEDIFDCIFLNEYDRIRIQISLKYVPRSPIGKTPVIIILWCPITKMLLKACFLVQPLEQEGVYQKYCISLCSKVFINHFYQMKASPECLNIAVNIG